MRIILAAFKLSLLLGTVTIFLTSLPVADERLTDERLTAEDIIAKHIESIGSREKLAEIRNRLVVGPTQFSLLRSAAGGILGRAVIVSEDKKLFFGTSFDSASYPGEKIAFDGKTVGIGFISPGNRSAFGNFILENKSLFRDGLFTGALSSSWAMLAVGSDGGKVKMAGKKKIDGREAYVLEYLPRGGSDVDIRLYFDAETFHHVRSEYSQIFSAAQGLTINRSVKQVESRHRMTEDFSDFRDEGGLVLPHRYRIYLGFTGAAGTSEYEWNFELQQFLTNQKLDGKSFEIDSK